MSFAKRPVFGIMALDAEKSGAPARAFPCVVW